MKGNLVINKQNNHLLDFLNQDQEIYILSVYIDMRRKNISYQVIDKNNSPIVLDESDISISNNNIPSDWVMKTNGDFIEMTYSVFQKDGFWEDFFNGAAYAVTQYNNMINEIKKLNK